MMDQENINPSIECSVQQCTYHASKADYCSLDTVQIGTHESDPAQGPCTDCHPFRRKQ